MKMDNPARHTGRPAVLATQCSLLKLKLFSQACVSTRCKKLHSISELFKTHVPLVDGTLSEIPEAKPDSLRNVQAGHFQAIAVRVWVV